VNILNDGLLRARDYTGGVRIAKFVIASTALMTDCQTPTHLLSLFRQLRFSSLCSGWFVWRQCKQSYL